MKRMFCLFLAVVMLCGCTALTDTTAPTAVLKPGFYIYSGDVFNDTLLHFRFYEDGTGYLSMLGTEAELTWTPDGAIHGIAYDPMEVTATDDGILFDGEAFAWVGDSLPEDFFPAPPVPGVYAVSSVGIDGNVDFFGDVTCDNGYLELREDGTGVLVYDGAEYPFTMEGATAHFDGWSLMLQPVSGEETGGVPMIVIMVMDGPIEADSIVLWKMEE